MIVRTAPASPEAQERVRELSRRTSIITKGVVFEMSTLSNGERMWTASVVHDGVEFQGWGCEHEDSYGALWRAVYRAQEAAQ